MKKESAKKAYQKPEVTDEATFEARSGACLSLPQSVYLSVDTGFTCGGTNCSYGQGFPAQSGSGISGAGGEGNKYK